MCDWGPMKLREFIAHVFGGALAHWIAGGLVVVVALAIPYWARVQELWSWPIVIALAIVLFAAGLVIYRNLFPKGPRPIPTHVRLQFNQTPNFPTEQGQSNIWRWFRAFPRRPANDNAGTFGSSGSQYHGLSCV
jgi:hypothetical protein